MFRSAGKLVGGAAGIAASGPAVSAQCRAQQPRHLAPAHVQEELHKRVEAGQKAFDPAGLGEDWLVTDLKHALDEDQVIFGAEEINETMQSVFAFTTGERQEQHHAGVRITEVDEQGEAVAEDDSNIHMQAAEMQLMAPREVEEDFNRMLSKLLHNREVQSACVKALRDDQAFQGILNSPDTAPITVPITKVLPSGSFVEEDDEEDGEPNGFVELIRNLASGIKHLGDAIRQKALGARNLIGKLFIELGCSLHEMMGQPFGGIPVDESNEDVNPRAEMVGNALITVACAILTLVLVKRVHRIRFV